MRKPKILEQNLLLGLTFFTAFLLFFFHEKNTQPLHGYFLTAADYQAIRSERTETKKELLTEINFDEVPLLRDRGTKRWFWSVGTNHDPAVAFSGENGTKLAFRAFVLDDRLTESGEGVPFLVYTDTSYQEYFLVPTTLPLMSLNTAGEISNDRIDIEAEMLLIDNRPEAKMPVIKASGAVHKRGWSSIVLPKGNLKLTLYDKAATGRAVTRNEWDIPLLGLRNDGDWVLNGMYTDFEKVRNSFSTNLWFRSCANDNEFGFVNGNEYRYLELFLNGDYHGLYALGYPIDAKQVHIHELNPGKYDEFLYKQQVWGPENDGNPEWDGETLELPADEETTNNGRVLIKRYYQMLKDRDPNLIWYTDWKTTIDVYLFLRLIQAEDTVGKTGKFVNMMMTFKKGPEGYRLVFAPWDMDISWGNKKQSSKISNGTGSYKILPEDNSYEMAVNPLAAAFADGNVDLMRLTCKRYDELRKGPWREELLLSMTDSMERDIFTSGAFRRDALRWPQGNSAEPDLGLSKFRDHVSSRLASMDAFMEKECEAVPAE